MNKKMIYLAALINAATQQINVPQTYSTKFKTSGNAYLSPTEKIRVDELADHFVVAGIVGRNEVLPILGKDGFSTIEFAPDIIGGQFTYTPTDVIQLQAGVPTYTKDGSVVESAKALEVKYAKIARAAIANKFERQCAEVYLKGTYTGEDKKPLTVGKKENKTLTLTGKKCSDEIIKLFLDYRKKFNVSPKMEVGMSVFNSIKNEANDSNQNVNGVKFQMGDVPKLTIGNFVIEMLEDTKGPNGDLIDTSKTIILSDPKGLAVGYGCLQYGDIKTNESKLIKAEMIAGELRVEETSGQKGIWAKSAPMPIILTLDKFVRYTVTL